jgi:hypothetical protein
LASQAAFDLGHEVFRQSQVIEGLLEGLDSVLGLATVAREALLRCATATLSGFGVFFSVSCGEGHGALLCSVRVVAGCSLPKRT